ncbi:uncharacterized protein LOC108117339 isoform X2 [Drosophila eugracilis]|uniref:uncharacterized protein LOC108117339 isoform X2 n=1 Tax=Drosophila eugracilis TaxID=29029 RepID=UPI0007E7B524|nr:uncharacterized protein LOC108117339 isoform X2 [Drosophila eugracilis]
MDLEGNREIQAKKNALYLAVILLLCLTITVGCYFFIKDNGNGLYIKRDEWTSVVSIGRPFLDHPVKKVVLYFEPAYRCETRNAWTL